ncbi:MAG TPA: LacI family DNA-binding transcriptional regulator [Bauldia sp.]|nr:LacI family DNA-binding transcriptional regulator [Bauldia sp.]
MDVATRAGVSEVTASRALRRPEMVSAELRHRVEAAVRELAYIPNRLASALASARTRTIGAVVPSFTNGVFADYLRALHDAFLPRGFQVLVLNSRYSDAEEERAIATLLGNHPEAMIVAGIDQTPRARRLLEESGVPVIQTMELTENPIDVNIGLSQYDAAAAAADYLIASGHRRIANITAPVDARAARRLDGFFAAVARSGLTMERMVATDEGPASVTVGRRLFAELITRWPDVDAVFCGNDYLALGCLFECERRGIKVPADMAIIGFNDVEFCASAFPSLSSVATPRYEMARRASEIVLEIIRGSGDRPTQRRIDLGYRIMPRDSTRPISVLS